MSKAGIGSEQRGTIALFVAAMCIHQFQNRGKPEPLKQWNISLSMETVLESDRLFRARQDGHSQISRRSNAPRRRRLHHTSQKQLASTPTEDAEVQAQNLTPPGFEGAAPGSVPNSTTGRTNRTAPSENKGQSVLQFHVF